MGKFSAITKINGSELCLECLSLFVLQMDVRIKSTIICNLFAFILKKRHTFACADDERQSTLNEIDLYGAIWSSG